MNVENRWAVTTELTEPMEVNQYKGRTTGLAIYGSLQIAMGGLSALMVPLMVLSIAVNPAAGGASIGQMIPAVSVYAVLAVLLVTLGIGSVRARRWARALTLVLAWMWLVIGAISLISMLFFMPTMTDMMAAQPQQPSPMMMNAIFTVMIVMMVAIYILLPAVFIVFYQRSDVKETCERMDPVVRWTDRVPLPVLSLSIVLAMGATSIFWAAGYGFVVPFFGILLKGVTGAILVVGISALFAYLARATYKLKITAWWTTLVVFVLFFISTIISFSIISLIDLYREMGFPEDQLDMMERTGTLDMNLPLMMSINLVVIVGYLIWVRKYFDTAAESPPPSPT